MGLDEPGVRYAGYPELADAVRKGFTDPARTLRELFARIVFNICIGNTDDHLRNHAGFWNGTLLSLTPAYDLCPQPRSGETANQALDITRTPGERASQLRLCRKAAPEFLLSESQADEIIEHQLEVIAREWHDAADEAQLTKAERTQLWQRQILNPYIHYDQAWCHAPASAPPRAASGLEAFPARMRSGQTHVPSGSPTPDKVAASSGHRPWRIV